MGFYAGLIENKNKTEIFHERNLAKNAFFYEFCEIFLFEIKML
jgi:hypothetical protein